jgi:segregation and condensation protein A
MFRVELDFFRGPLDLLLFLVKRQEVDIHDIPIARIAEQYLGYLDILEQLDVNAVGDFLEMASTLVEIKSQMVLPRAADEADVIEDPREELVQRLLEYKKFKDAASMLEERSRRWQQRYPRMGSDLPPRKFDPADQPIHELELWDLVSAFSRIVRDASAVKPTTIVYDDTPIHVYMQRIHQKLCERGECTFGEMFAAGMHKSALIGVFLSILELVRHHSVVCEQSETHGEIVVLPGPAFTADAEFGEVDAYEHRKDDERSAAPDAEEPAAETANPEPAEALSTDGGVPQPETNHQGTKSRRRTKKKRVEDRG